MPTSPTQASPLTIATEDEMMAWVRAMGGFGARRVGSDAGRRCEDYLHDQLVGMGLPHVRKEPIDVEVWTPNDARLEVRASAVDAGADGDGWLDVLAQWIPHCAWTPPAGLDAPLVLATPSGRGHAAWRGKIVVAEIRFPMLDARMLERLSFGTNDPDHDIATVQHPATWVRLGWHLYRRAAAAGAVGFVGILRDQPGGTHRMYAPYGFKERDILDKPLPGVWVGRAWGERLIDRARRGERARLTVTGSRGPGVTHNVVAELPGQPGAPDEAIVVHCHHDSPFVSPVEDASGCAVILAVAKALAARPPLRRRVIVLFTAGHFYGSIGTRTFIARHRATLVPKVALEITAEHVAKEAIEDAAGRLVPSGKPEATGVFVPFQASLARRVLAAATRHGLARVVALPPEGPLGEYPPTDGGDWHAAGVPLVNFISNPVYLLTDDDDYRWVDGPRMPRLAATIVDLVTEADALSKAELARTDGRARQLLMRGLMHVLKARTTYFGTRPIY